MTEQKYPSFILLDTSAIINVNVFPNYFASSESETFFIINSLIRDEISSTEMKSKLESIKPLKKTNINIDSLEKIKQCLKTINKSLSERLSDADLSLISTAIELTETYIYNKSEIKDLHFKKKKSFLQQVLENADGFWCSKNYREQFCIFRKLMNLSIILTADLPLIEACKIFGFRYKKIKRGMALRLEDFEIKDDIGEELDIGVPTCSLKRKMEIYKPYKLLKKDNSTDEDDCFAEVKNNENRSDDYNHENKKGYNLVNEDEELDKETIEGEILICRICYKNQKVIGNYFCKSCGNPNLAKVSWTELSKIREHLKGKKTKESERVWKNLMVWKSRKLNVNRKMTNGKREMYLRRADVCEIEQKIAKRNKRRIPKVVLSSRDLEKSRYLRRKKKR